MINTKDFDWESELASEVIDIIFNREAGWTEKLDDTIAIYRKKAIQADRQQLLKTPIVQEFLKDTPAWVANNELIEHYTESECCKLCGINHKKIHELWELLKAKDNMEGGE